MEITKRNTIGMVLLIIICTANIILSGQDIASAANSDTNGLIAKISKDYTKKFCNSIGFGLSKESAMNFSYSENKKIFEKRKGMKDLDKELLAEKIGISVVDGCGYKLNLYGEKDIQDFAKYYLSIENIN
tara:strand:- start:50 stop:439 length:390 start_codon:yes stop_codon:yes gene_type:complete